MIIEKIAYDVNDNPITSLVQWDKDVYIYISDPDIRRAYNMYFYSVTSNVSEALAVTGTFSGNKLRAKIPNSLLTQPYVIIGYVEIPLDGGYRNIYRIRIRVTPMPKPKDYVDVFSRDYLTVASITAELSGSLEEFRFATEDAISRMEDLSVDVNRIKASLESTSVQFNVTSYHDGNGNVSIIATVVGGSNESGIGNYVLA